MSEKTVTKQSPVSKIKNFVARNERKILLTTTVTSTAMALVMRSNIAKHNEFLKEHELFNAFYEITPTEG